MLGAHLEGMPLNWQLTERGGRMVKRCRTAPGYRLYALAGTKPLKPGLIRDDNFTGPGIEAEVWSVPEDQFGSFVAAVPPPLGIGSAVLDSGETVKSFICEPWAVAGATEITALRRLARLHGVIEVTNRAYKNFSRVAAVRHMIGS